MVSPTLQTVLALIEQLSPQEQTQLAAHLLEHAQSQPQSAAEKLKALREIQVNTPIQNEPSLRREDWYDENGR
jgi:hypothetical protein